MMNFFRRQMKMIAVFLAAVLMLAAPISSFAAVSWVAQTGDTVAESAILIDAKTGTVLWGKNVYDQYYPASITKLLTALVVLENCELSETVTVSEEAVKNLESGAVAIGLSAGDQLSVEDLLYAMLLRSCNDAANALAVHVSGSIEEFGVKMTERAKELGCQGSVFRNPSGLTKPENLTTAYDMALIGAACSYTPGFLEIESQQRHHVGPMAKHPDGATVYAEHKMIVKGSGYTDSRVIGGKTGFIKASGNTLVTIAESEGQRLVAVVLKDKNPDHYKDTRMLLNFGFENFDDQVITDPAKTFAAFDRLKADKIIDPKRAEIVSYEDAVVTLPVHADINDVKVSYEYNLPASAPQLAVAELIFRYADVRVGNAYVLNDRDADIAIETQEEQDEAHGLGIHIPVQLVIGIAVVLVAVMAIGTVVMIILFNKKKEADRRARLLERRRNRLRELNLSEEDFAGMVTKKRNRKNE